VPDGATELVSFEWPKHQQTGGRSCRGGPVEEAAGAIVGGQQLFDAAAQRGVAAAGLVQVGGARGPVGQVHGGQEDGLYVGRHGALLSAVHYPMR
jgi:hypothetical protein